MHQINAIIVKRRLGCLAALAGLFGGSLLYRSYEHREVFGRYSPVFAVILAVLGLGLSAGLLSSLFAPRRDPRQSDARLFFELGCACWGLAYFLSALYDPDNGGRFLELNFFATPYPISALLEYLALCSFLTALSLGAAHRVGRRIAQTWGLTALTVSVLLVLGEGISRVAAFVGAQSHGIPSYSGTVFTRRYVRLNSEGFRDVEHSVERHRGVRRLLLVGDSYAFGAGIRDASQRLGEQLELALSRGDTLPWEVVNFSFGDKDTMDEIAYLRRGIVYHPDGVLLLYVFNDADYLTMSHAPASSQLGREAMAKSVTDRNPIFAHSTSIVELLRPERLLYWNSFLFQEIYVRWRLIKLEHFQDASDQRLHDVYRTPELLSQHLRDLQSFVKIADSAHARVWIAPIDIGVPSISDQTERYQTFLEAARAAGLPIIPLGEVFRSLPLADIVVNKFDGHPNPVAARLAANAISTAILDVMHPSRPSEPGK